MTQKTKINYFCKAKQINYVNFDYYYCLNPFDHLDSTPIAN